MKKDLLTIAGEQVNSRLITGTRDYVDHNVMIKALKNSGAHLVTLDIKQLKLDDSEGEIQSLLTKNNLKALPTTLGATASHEAIFTARQAREILKTNWIKLEIHPNTKYFLPDSLQTLKAAEVLCQEGFVVIPCIQADPLLAKQLEQIGCAALMVSGSPAGIEKGLASEDFLALIIEQAQIPIIIDGGIYKTSHAARAIEMGADAVVIERAIVASSSPITTSKAFAQAIIAARQCYALEQEDYSLVT
jgi:thiazole synthase